jgi:hypothetical protein
MPLFPRKQDAEDDDDEEEEEEAEIELGDDDTENEEVSLRSSPPFGTQLHVRMRPHLFKFEY